MISFWVGAGLLVLLAFVFVLYPLRKVSRAHIPDRILVNQAIFEQKQQELKSEYDAGVYSQEEYHEALTELQRTFLDDATVVDQAKNPVHPRSVKALAGVIGIVLPLSAVILYMQFSTGYQVSLNTSAQNDSIDTAISGLIARLQEQPGDIEGWKMLGRTYFAQQKFAEAASVYQKLNEITQSSDPDALVGQAEASAYLINQQFTSDLRDLLRKALDINPSHERALWYSGYAAYQDKDYRAAVDSWQRLLDLVPDDQTDIKSALQNFLTEARNKAETGVDDQFVARNKDADKAATPRIQVKVTIDESLFSELEPTDTIFVYARAAQGPKMPLALIRRQVGTWPLQIELNEQQAMIEGMTLSSFDRIQVVARVSKSGMATPQSGDLIGETLPFNVNTQSEVQVKISQRVP